MGHRNHIGNITARRPDIVLVDKDKKEVSLIDISVPTDRNIPTKQDEKIHKYQDLKMEVKRLWKKKRLRVLSLWY